MEWKRYCNADQPMCVEVAHMATGEVLVRNSSNPARDVEFSEEEWSTFVAAVRAGEEV